MFGIDASLREIGFALVEGMLYLMLMSAFAAASWIMLRYAASFHQKLMDVDVALAPFGQTLAGKTLHEFAVQLYQGVDEPDDALIAQTMVLLWRVLPQTKGFITAQQVSDWLKDPALGLVKLLDGVPAIPQDQFPATKAMGEKTSLTDATH